MHRLVFNLLTLLSRSFQWLNWKIHFPSMQCYFIKMLKEVINVDLKAFWLLNLIFNICFAWINQYMNDRNVNMKYRFTTVEKVHSICIVLYIRCLCTLPFWINLICSFKSNKPMTWSSDFCQFEHNWLTPKHSKNHMFSNNICCMN